MCIRDRYELTSTEVTEARETVDADGKVTTVQVRVFETTLTVIPFPEAAAEQLTPEQLARFQQNINKEALKMCIRDRWQVRGYTVLLCFTLFKTGTLAKSIFEAH